MNKRFSDVCGQNEEDEVWRLTPWGCLSAVLDDYNIYCGHITSKMGVHLVNDFMEAMEKAGYVERRKDD